MSDVDGDGVFEITLGASDLKVGTGYQFVISVNGWGEQSEAVPWSECDFLRHDEWPNFGFTVPSTFDFSSDKVNTSESRSKELRKYVSGTSTGSTDILSHKVIAVK